MQGRFVAIVVALFLTVPAAAQADTRAHRKALIPDLLSAHRSGATAEAMHVGDLDDAQGDVYLKWHEVEGEREETGAFDSDIASMRVDYDDAEHVLLEVTMFDPPAEQWSVTIWHIDVDDDGTPDYELDHAAEADATRLLSVDTWLDDEPVDIACDGLTGSHSATEGRSSVTLPADCITSPDAVAVHVLSFYSNDTVTAVDVLPDGPQLSPSVPVGNGGGNGNGGRGQRR